MSKENDERIAYLMGAYPSLAPEIARLAAIAIPVAGQLEPPAEQPLLIGRDPAEGRKSRSAPRSRRRRR